MTSGTHGSVLFGAFALFLCAWGVPAQAQHTDATAVEIEDPRPLVEDDAWFRQVEIVAAVDPTDSANMIVAAVADSSGGDAIAAYRTSDGGDEWKRAESRSGALFPGGDPALTFDADGRAYLASLASGLTIWRSDDGGRTWQVVEVKEETYDRPWVAASKVSGEGPPPVYAAGRTGEGQVGFAVHASHDRGETFRELTRFRVDSTVFHSVSDLEVRPDGTLLVPHLVHFGYVPGEGALVRGERRLLISTDGGDTWTGAHRVAENRTYGNRGPEDQMLMGLGGGRIAVDASGGRFEGSAYMAWPQVVDGFLQIVLARSRDGGRTWSEPQRVNEGGRRSHHSTPEAAVNGDGVVAVTWNDRRHDPDHRCYHHYVAISRDGGRTFGEKIRISPRETCFPSGYRWQNGGETQGLIPLSNGDFRVVWTGPGPEGSQPWTAVVRVD